MNNSFYEMPLFRHRRQLTVIPSSIVTCIDTYTDLRFLFTSPSDTSFSNVSPGINRLVFRREVMAMNELVRSGVLPIFQLWILEVSLKSV